MKMKKIAVWLLALAMVVTLAACGSSEKKESTAENKSGSSSTSEAKKEKKEGEKTSTDFSGKTLRLAGLLSGYGDEGWKAVIQGFEKKTGAKVESKFEKNIAEVLRPQITAGDVPDVIYNSMGGEGALNETMIKEKMLLDISDVMEGKVLGEEKTVKEKLIPGFLDTYNTQPYGDKKTYLAPLFYSPTGLWYNKAMFKEDGGKYELPKTFDEFFALGEAAKADGKALFTYPTSGYFDSFSFALLNEVGGADLFNKLMNYDADAWEKEAKPYFDTVAKLKGYLEKNTVAQANQESFTKNQFAVMEDKALFMPNGNWIIGEMEKAQKESQDNKVSDKFAWGYMALPALKEGGDRYAYTFFEQCFIPKNAQEPELAKAFISYLYSDEAVKAFYEKGKQLQPVVDADKLITDPVMKEVYGVYSKGAKPAMGSFAAVPAVEGVNMSDALFTTIDSVMSGSKTAEDWQKGVVDAAKQLKAALGK